MHGRAGARVSRPTVFEGLRLRPEPTWPWTTVSGEVRGMFGRVQGSTFHARIGCVGLALCLWSVAAWADEPGAAALEIRAINPAARGVLVISFDEISWDQSTQTYQWTAAQPLDVLDPNTGQRVATLVDGSLTIQLSNPVRCDVNVQVWAGVLETQVEIRVPPAVLIPLTLQESQFRASAAVTAADLDGDGALVSSIGPLGSGIYRSYVTDLLGQEQLFSQLVASVFAGSGGVATGTQNDPPVGYRPVGFEVSELRAEIAFSVTAQDLATVVTSIRSIPSDRCAGDMNDDELRDLGDLNRLLLSFGRCEGDGGFTPDADLFPDGCVDLRDLSLMLRVFGAPCP